MHVAMSPPQDGSGPDVANVVHVRQAAEKQ